MRALLVWFTIVLSSILVDNVNAAPCCNTPCNGSPAFSASPYCCYGGGGSVVSGVCGCYVQQWSCSLGGSITSSTSSLSVARSALTGTKVVGTNKILFAGGVNSGTVQNRVDVYDTTTNAFTTTLSLSAARSGLASVSVGNYTLFAGGVPTGGGVSAVVDLYNSQSNSWSVGTLSFARTNIVTATVGTKALFASGSPAGSGNVDLFDASTQTWTTALLSVARQSIVAVSLSGGLAVFAGGQAGGIDSAAVDLYNGSTWSTSTLTQAQQGMVGASVKNVAIFGGGISAGSVTANLFLIVYTPHNGYIGWFSKSLSVARNNHVAVALGNYIIFAGGTTSGGVASNVVDIFNVISQTLVTTVTLSSARSSLSAAAFNGVALFGGGIVSGGAVTTAVDVMLMPASWYVGNWTNCISCARSRIVYCQDISGQEQDASACSGDKPITSQTDCCHSPYTWITGLFSRCPSGCGTTGVMKRTVSCYSAESYVAPDDRCDLDTQPLNNVTCITTDQCSSTGLSGSARVSPVSTIVLAFVVLLLCILF